MSFSKRSIQSETLDLLEWLCQQVATFATTKLGQRAAQALPISDRLEQSLELLSQTREVYQLEAIGGRSWPQTKNGPLPGKAIGEVLTLASNGN